MRLRLFLLGLIICLVNCEAEDESPDRSVPEKKEKAKYVKPVPNGASYFVETFDSNIIGTKWVKSKAKKDDVEDSIAKYDGEWSVEASLDSVLDGDKGLVLKSKAKHHAIASKLSKRFDFTNNKPLVVQYEVKFQNPLECGGAYVKLISDDANFKLENFYDKTGFSIMFGPDKCGTETKFHFIIRFKHPVKGTYEEKHAKKSELLDAIFSDGKTHLYTLIVNPDNTFKMLIDSTQVNSGSLLNDLNPPINPEREIVDPNDKKPEGWDDREKIPDPDAVKPDDWDESEPKTIPDPNAKIPIGWLEDEPETIPDLTAVRPEDWDDSTDGEWEAPKVDNPKCKSVPGCGKWNPPTIVNPKFKGKWRAPLIENTNYQGKWEPRKILNPDFFEDTDPFKSLTSFSAIGLELWSMTDSIYFDNFLITDDESVADQFAKDSWVIKKNLEYASSSSSDSVIEGLVKATNERPWLWAIYVLVILLPIVIITVFCCGKSAPTKPTDAEVKKTDAKTEDDKESAEEKDAESEANLEGQSPEEDQEEEEQEDDNDDEVKVDKEDLENLDDNDAEANNQDENEQTETNKKSPVRRRARKV